MAITVILDAGHHQFTSGKASPDGTYKEFEFNIDVRERISKHLKRHGVPVKFVDSNKTGSAELIDLVKQANRFKNAIYVSIHTNAYGTSWTSPSGWEIYCYNLVSSSNGYKLAKCIHDASIPALGLVDRGIKNGSHLYVIKKTTMPAVLIEHGFHTNKEEVAKLKSPEFREKVAVCDCKGILKYLGINWKDEVKEAPKKLATTPPSSDNKKLYRVQVAAFSSKHNAENYTKKLKADGYVTTIIEDTSSSKKLYKIQVGAFASKENANNFAKKLQSEGYTTTIIG